MNIRLVLGFGSLIVASAAMFTSSMVQMSMVDAINKKRPRDEKVSPYWWTFGKTMNVLALYRADYPEGRLHLYMWAAAGIGLAGVLTGALCFGIIGPSLPL